jgi:hypothetical protein
MSFLNIYKVIINNIILQFAIYFLNSEEEEDYA